MHAHEIIALLAAGLCMVSTALFAASKYPAGGWRWPFAFMVFFGCFSLYAGFIEGSMGFWPIHAASGLWGNQVWFDLLIAASVSFFFFVPRARKQNMNPWPWLALILLTGSIGILAAISRLLYLESKSGA
jgi:hypothetical protein